MILSLETISKMAEPPKNGVWMIIFLIEVDFRIPFCNVSLGIIV